jgi:hypothetical protein
MLPSLELPLPAPDSIGPPTLCTPFEARRVGRKVHFRFLCAHRLHGNFLSHFVLVFAQLLQAIGVRPADLGIIPCGGRPSSLFWLRPWTV